MKKTLKLLVAVLCIALAFSACKKNKGNSPTGGATSMKFTVNGTAVSYNTCLELTATINDIDHLVITGDNINGAKHSDDNFELEIIHDLATLKAGQTFQVSADFSSANSVNIWYSPNATDSFVSQAGNPNGSVTITAVTSTTITGTFQGKLYGESDYSGTDLKYTVTNGAFTARIVK